MRSMNDRWCIKRRGLILAVEKDLELNKERWKNMWDESTCDPMWQMLNTEIVMKHAKFFFQYRGHRDELYEQIDNERNELLQQRFRLLDNMYLLEQRMCKSEFQNAEGSLE